jgi:FMN phosphatase YigB (HAD superfamily)
MLQAIITDLSKVLLFPKDPTYKGSLNSLHLELLEKGDYDFWQYFILNEELLNFYRELPHRIDIFILTTKHIQEHPPLKEKLNNLFKKIYVAKDMGLSKKDPAIFKELLEDIQIDPNNLLYIDDNQENLDAASQIGLQTIQYESNDQVIGNIKTLT